MVLAQKQTHRSMKQNREPRKLFIYGQLIHDKRGKNIQWRKDRRTVSSINGTGKIEEPYAKE